MTTNDLIDKAKKAAVSFGVDPVLVCAVIEQESGWDTYAIRPESESGFMDRYGDAYHKIVFASASKNDDHWIRYEDIFYCSYGLMQTMYPVIIETFPEQIGLLEYPTRLCDPDIGLNVGIRLLVKKIMHVNGDLRQALLNWNGGGNPNYPDEVLARQSKYV